MPIIKHKSNRSLKKYTPEERNHYIEKWRNSKLTRSEFCRQEELPLQTFCYWVNSQSSRKPKQPSKSALSFLPLGPALTDTNKPCVEIILPNGYRCNFTHFANTQIMVAIVKELSHVTYN